MNTTYYYKSPIGIIKLICNETFLIEMSFVEKEKENLDKYPSIVSTCKEQLDLYFAGSLIYVKKRRYTKQRILYLC